MTDLTNLLKIFLQQEINFGHSEYIEILKLLQPTRSLVSNFSFGHSQNPPNTIDSNLLGFIEDWDVFGRKAIPFELWSDICEEGLQLLKKLLEDPSIPFKELEGFKDFKEKVYEKINAIRELGDADITAVLNDMDSSLNKRFTKKQLREWELKLKGSSIVDESYPEAKDTDLVPVIAKNKNDPFWFGILIKVIIWLGKISAKQKKP